MKRYIRSSDSAEFTDAQLVRLLRDHGIDTSVASYELRIEDIDTGRQYSNHFKCHGDWLACFSMALHSEPYAEAIEDYFSIDEFMDMLNSWPDVSAISVYMATHYSGDGHDLIIYLRNMTSGKYLVSEDVW